MRKRSAFLAVAAVIATAAVAMPSVTKSTSRGDTRIDSVVVNNGRTVVLGTRAASFPVSVTATDDSGIKSVGPVGVWGPKYGILKVSRMKCRAISPTTSTCTGTASVNPGRHQVWNDEAGSWYVDAQAHANDGDDVQGGDIGGFSLKREGRLGIYDLPSKVAAGRQAPVHGWLSRVWWDTGAYHGSPEDSVQLMFRPDGSDTWTAVSNQVTNDLGQVGATVRFTRSGWYQWSFPGSKWTGAVRSAAKHVTVT